MGMAMYFLKGRFPSPKAAASALPKVEEFLSKMAEAEEEWRTMREQRDAPIEENLEVLKKKYPEVFEKLGIAQQGSRKMTENLWRDCLPYALNSPAADPDWTIWQEKAIIGFHAYIWHHADWDPLVTAIKSFGALRADWINDEQIDPYKYLRV